MRSLLILPDLYGQPGVSIGARWIKRMKAMVRIFGRYISNCIARSIELENHQRYMKDDFFQKNYFHIRGGF